MCIPKFGLTTWGNSFAKQCRLIHQLVEKRARISQLLWPAILWLITIDLSFPSRNSQGPKGVSHFPSLMLRLDAVASCESWFQSVLHWELWSPTPEVSAAWTFRSDFCVATNLASAILRMSDRVVTLGAFWSKRGENDAWWWVLQLDSETIKVLREQKRLSELLAGLYRRLFWRILEMTKQYKGMTPDVDFDMAAVRHRGWSKKYLWAVFASANIHIPLTTIGFHGNCGAAGCCWCRSPWFTGFSLGRWIVKLQLGSVHCWILWGVKSGSIGKSCNLGHLS